MFAPDYTKISFVPLLANGTLNTVLPITKRNWTWYGVFGETFSGFCVALGVVYLLLAFLKASWLDRLFTLIPFLRWIKIAGNELHHRQVQPAKQYAYAPGEVSADPDGDSTSPSSEGFKD